MKKTCKERFDSKWETDRNGCWLWTGYVTPDGYGRFQLDRSSRLAHRVAHEIYIGAIPDGLEIDHLCRVRSCVNPEHLETVTHQENLRRGEIGAYNAAKTHCKRGHALTGDNLYPKNGRRHCRECRTLASRRARAKRRSITSDSEGRFNVAIHGTA